MKSSIWLGVVGLVVVFAGSSCSHKAPEDFCQGWVASTCQAISGCCQNGDLFDLDACQISLSASCQKETLVDQVQDGTRFFDASAAAICFGSITSCADEAALTDNTSYVYEQACANMVTGNRPNSASCTLTSDCERVGDFSDCYTGGGQAGMSGVCAKVVLDQNTCSFTFSTGELHVCPDQTYCDRGSFMVNPSYSPSIKEFEFTANCIPYLTEGADCSGGGTTDIVPCQDGLYCAVTGPNKAACTQRQAEGASCMIAEECAATLDCLVDTGGMGKTCQPAQGSSFCFTPSTCGDGVCQPTENKLTCPQDCSTTGTCGDGICTPPETKATCPQDCSTTPTCGDGICTPPETQQTCPQDCTGSTCGDGICDTGEGATCPADCCGDGTCEPGESNATCPEDCP